MTTPLLRRAVLGPPWPVIVRIVFGAVAGFAAVELGVDRDGPGWRAPAAGIAAALVAVGAPAVGRWAGRGVATGAALATGIGLYLAVPETGHIMGAVAVLAVAWIAELTNRMRPDWLVVILLGVVLLWAAARGAAGREGPLLAGYGLLGYFLVAPLVAALPGPARPLLPRRYAAAAVVVLQFLFAVGVARLGAVRAEVAQSVVVTGLALAVLVISVRVAAGPRP